MRRFLLVALLMCSAASVRADDPCPEPPGSTFGEKGKLQGTWKLVKLEFGGMNFGGKIVMSGETKLVVESNKMKMTGLGNNTEGSYKLDTSGKLKHIDLITKDKKTSKGIYKLEKDQLTIAFCTSGDTNRPKGFDDKKVAVMTFKKEK